MILLICPLDYLHCVYYFKLNIITINLETYKRVTNIQVLSGRYEVLYGYRKL